MARFLFTWELGGGLGHIANLQPIARGLATRGHHVELALCGGEKAAEYFPGISLHQAPLSKPRPGQHIVEPSTFAEVLFNSGCDEAERLATVVTQWRSLFDEVKPDVLIAEFSPLAFVAAQGYPVRTVQMATGHAWPPNISPLPDLCPWRNNYPERLAMIESRVHQVLQDFLSQHGQPGISQVAELFTRADVQLLTTFPEMDHYQNRVGGNYVGNWSHLAGESPSWPEVKNPRVFAYLKTPVAVKAVLGELQRRGIATLALVPDKEKLGLPSESGCIRITDRPVDIDEAAAQCDLAVLHTGHGTTVQMLLSGKPILAIPLLGEQAVVAENVVRLGAGVTVEADNPVDIARGLKEILTNESYAQAARRFQEKYAEFNRDAEVEKVLDLLENLG